MLSSTCLFHRALRRAGAEAELFIFEAMPHAHWYTFYLPEAHEVIEITVRFFRSGWGNDGIAPDFKPTQRRARIHAHY